MGLIRNAAAATIARDAIVLDLGDLQRQGELLKRRAREEAERILAAARQERQRLISGAAEEGRKAGHAEGMKQGLEEGRREGHAAALEERRAELAPLVAGWTTALADFNERRERMLAEAKVDVVRLALSMGERVTRRLVEADGGIVEEQMRAVLAAVARPTRLKISVHPDDVGVAQAVMPEVAAAMGEHAELVADESLARGSCVARTEEGAQIDASIETQLARVVEALLPGYGGGPRDDAKEAGVQDGPA